MHPVLTTGRLRLTVPVLADLDEVHDMWCDLETVRFIPVQVPTRTESWQRLVRHVGHWALLGHGSWTVRERATGRFAGTVGFDSAPRDTDPPLVGPEAGWMFHRDLRGSGLALEAVGAMLGFADRAGWRWTGCIISPDNARSRRLAERVGYAFVARGRSGGTTALFYARPAGAAGARG